VPGTDDVHTGNPLVVADAYRSVVPKAVAADRPDARFRRDVLWLGIDKEGLGSVL
jgi:hypothetical protein